MKFIYAAVLGMLATGISFAQGNPTAYFIYPSDTITSLGFSYHHQSDDSTLIVICQNYRPSDDPGSDGVFYVYEKNPTSGVWDFHQKVVHYYEHSPITFFGQRTDFDGNQLIVAAERAATAPNQGISHGKAFIYQVDAQKNWSLDTALSWPHPDSTAVVDYGRMVAIDGNYAMVLVDRFKKIYVYEKDANGIWNHIQEIDCTAYTNTSGSSMSSRFGDYFEIHGEYSYFSAIHDDTDENGANVIAGSGAIYVYHRDPNTGLWSEFQKFTSPSRKVGDNFPNGFYIQDDLAVFGVYDSDATPMIYRRDANMNWNYDQSLFVADSFQHQSSRYMRYSRSGNRMAVSLSNATVDSVKYAGKIYLFDLNTTTDDWEEVMSWHEDIPAYNSSIGPATLVDENELLVANHKFKTGNLTNAGRLIVVSLNSGIDIEEINPDSEFISLAPNPTSTSFNVLDSNTQDPLVEYLLLDINGREIVNGSLVNSNSIDVANLPSGLYILKATSSNGRVAFGRIIKE